MGIQSSVCVCNMALSERVWLASIWKCLLEWMEQWFWHKKVGWTLSPEINRAMEIKRGVNKRMRIAQFCSRQRLLRVGKWRLAWRGPTHVSIVPSLTPTLGSDEFLARSLGPAPASVRLRPDSGTGTATADSGNKSGSAPRRSVTPVPFCVKCTQLLCAIRSLCVLWQCSGTTPDLCGFDLLHLSGLRVRRSGISSWIPWLTISWS